MGVGSPGLARRGAIRLAVSVSAALPVLASGAAAAERPYPVTEKREACREYAPQRRPLFGDTHVHTSYSVDAAGQGNRATPRDAYRFARGETLGLAPFDAEGKPLRSARLERPLDFSVVTDHAEGLGEVRTCLTPGLPGYDSDLCWTYREPRMRPLIRLVIISRLLIQRERWPGICGEDGCRTEARSVWEDIRAAAEEAYDRSAECRFTSFVGYEFTASTGSGTNLHRNVVFRNHRVPAMPASWTDTPSAAHLWERLRAECIEGIPGCDALTIPHNSNLSSNGLMFATAWTESARDRDRPITPEEARQRRRFEPVIEIMQHKGDSECRLGLDTVDEECGFEKLPYNSFAGLSAGPAMRSLLVPSGGGMVRAALRRGLELEQAMGENPFRYGILASTDTHLATPGLVEEFDSKGHGGAGATAGEGGVMALPDNIEFNPGGLAAVWAEENSRDAIFEALLRREVYGTSGPRPVVRFFGGWGLGEGLCETDDFAARGYAGGVPMGGGLPEPPAGAGAPAFAVWALQDPGTEKHPGAPLQRIQIVKGWVDADGASHEKVHEVAGGPNDASVDLATCQRRGSGAASLCGVWRDPDFDPGQRAFYYARVLENPSCRWSQYACLGAGVDCGKPASIRPGFEACCAADHRPVIQERAWTSPIWYSPAK